MTRRTVIKMVVALVMVAFASPAVAAYPNKPVNLVVAYGAGGSTDLEARAFAQAVGKIDGTTVMVNNRPGGGGIIGSQFARSARADGYTLLYARIGAQCFVPALQKQSPYAWDSYTIIGLVQSAPFVFVVKNDSPYKTLADLVEAIKKKPGVMTFASSGLATTHNMGTTMLLQEAGLPANAAKMVAYKGGGEALAALVGGHVDFMGCNLGEASNLLQGGTLRALAVTSAERFPTIPAVPTVREAGYPKLEAIQGWSALYGPEKLPANVVAYWSDMLQKVKTNPDWNRMALGLGSVGTILPPEETKKYVKEQYELYKKLGESLGLDM